MPPLVSFGTKIKNKSNENLSQYDYSTKGNLVKCETIAVSSKFHARLTSKFIYIKVGKLPSLSNFYGLLTCTEIQNKV